MRRALVVFAAILALAFAALLGANYAVTKPQLAAQTETPTFGRKTVSRGEILAALGGCGSCHTKEGGQPYAGGRAIETPFGVIYATNITPHRENGIGEWSLAAFTRAMREGVSRSGAYLYPAFPYDHFSRVNDEDIEAIYAYFMHAVAPQAERTPANAMSFPFNIRQGLALWNAMFLKPSALQPPPGADPDWARGAYIAEGLGHCGACHSPRNALGAIDQARAYAGAFVNGWYAPALDKTAPAPIPWTQKALVNYLMDGWDKNHGLAAGSMAPVSSALRDQPEDDVFALAAYIVSLMGQRSPQEQAAAEARALALAAKTEWDPARDNARPGASVAPGQRLFQARCAECHKTGGKPAPLALNTSLNLPDPTNAVRATLHGVKPPRGALDRTMPAFVHQITEEETVDVMNFMRARFTERGPWSNLSDVVRRERERR